MQAHWKPERERERGSGRKINLFKDRRGVIGLIRKGIPTRRTINPDNMSPVFIRSHFANSTNKTHQSGAEHLSATGSKKRQAEGESEFRFSSPAL